MVSSAEDPPPPFALPQEQLCWARGMQLAYPKRLCQLPDYIRHPHMCNSMLNSTLMLIHYVTKPLLLCLKIYRYMYGSAAS